MEMGLSGGSLLLSKDPVIADVSFVVVPTPSFDDGSFNSTYVADCLEQIDKVNKLDGISRDHIAVIVSTVSPGTCARFEGLFPDLKIVYNPTFIAIGDVVAGLTKPDLLVIGASDAEAARDVVSIWVDVLEEPAIHCFSGDYTTAELIKLSVNAALGTKISLANSLGALFEAYGADPRFVEVVGYDHRIGTDFFTPGGPISGPCLPRDNDALQEAAWRVGVKVPISTATTEVNEIVFSRLLKQIKDHSPKTVGFLGMSYKYGTDVKTDSITSRLAPLCPGPLVQADVFAYDDTLPSDSLGSVLDCDVVVCTQTEYRQYLKPHMKVVDVWPT